MRCLIQWLFSALAAALAFPLWADEPAASMTNSAAPLTVSITPFPFDLTASAADAVGRITRGNENLGTVQLDNGIPWEEALSGEPFGSDLAGDWQRHKEAAGTKAVYLAIAPLQEDRIHWASGPGGAEAPGWATREKSLTPQLKEAYCQYVLRAIDYFKPQYLNLGVEAGDLAWKKPAKWPLFAELFSYCAAKARERSPSIKLGLSFSLPLLMNPGVVKRVQAVINESDYVGVSFYPYMSDFYVKLGASALLPPPVQWRGPLDWLRQTVSKPVAICETGYSSDTVSLPKFGLSMEATPDLQREYVADLATIARHEHYLFTVFFLAVDCDSLMRKLPGEAAANSLWTHCGFFDKEMRKKPAWVAYQQAWLGRANNATDSQIP